jgi:hypothetical protein
MPFRIVTEADGSVHRDFVTEPDQFGEHHVVLTGKATGIVRLNDGTLYDLTPEALQPAHFGHVHALNYHVGLQHEQLSREQGEAAPLGADFHMANGEKDETHLRGAFSHAQWLAEQAAPDAEPPGTVEPPATPGA